jgi:hypothetical protein
MLCFVRRRQKIGVKVEQLLALLQSEGPAGITPPAAEHIQLDIAR